jgi:hypothetical protein
MGTDNLSTGRSPMIHFLMALLFSTIGCFVVFFSLALSEFRQIQQSMSAVDD